MLIPLVSVMLTVSSRFDDWTVTRIDKQGLSAVAVLPTRVGAQFFQVRHLYVSADNGAGTPILVVSDFDLQCSQHRMRHTRGISEFPGGRSRFVTDPVTGWASWGKQGGPSELWDVPCGSAPKPNGWQTVHTTVGALVQDYFRKATGHDSPLPTINDQ